MKIVIFLKILAFLTLVELESAFNLEGRFDVNVLRDTLVFNAPCQPTLVIQIPATTEVASLMAHTLVASVTKVSPDHIVQQVFRVACAVTENALLEVVTMFACARRDSQENYASYHS